MSEDFPANSLSPKAAKSPKKVEKVVVGEVVERKTPLRKRLSNTFVQEDAQSIGQYILLEILIPAAKDLIYDVIIGGTERTLFGGSVRGGRSSYRAASHTNYNSMSRGPKMRVLGDEPSYRKPEMSDRGRATHDFGEIVLETRAEASLVLDQLGELIESYDMATVHDLYEMVGISKKSYADEKYGWTTMEGMSVRRVRDGYILDLPRPKVLE